jgi:hypothetical protein
MQLKQDPALVSSYRRGLARRLKRDQYLYPASDLLPRSDKQNRQNDRDEGEFTASDEEDMRREEEERQKGEEEFREFLLNGAEEGARSRKWSCEAWIDFLRSKVRLCDSNLVFPVLLSTLMRIPAPLPPMRSGHGEMDDEWIDSEQEEPASQSNPEVSVPMNGDEPLEIESERPCEWVRVLLQGEKGRPRKIRKRRTGIRSCPTLEQGFGQGITADATMQQAGEMVQEINTEEIGIPLITDPTEIHPFLFPIIPSPIASTSTLPALPALTTPAGSSPVPKKARGRPPGVQNKTHVSPLQIKENRRLAQKARREKAREEAKREEEMMRELQPGWTRPGRRVGRPRKNKGVGMGMGVVPELDQMHHHQQVQHLQEHPHVTTEGEHHPHDPHDPAIVTAAGLEELGMGMLDMENVFGPGGGYGGDDSYAYTFDAIERAHAAVREEEERRGAV